MQESVIIVEDVPLGDSVILVVRSEFGQCPIGDVFAAVRAVFVVGVKGETLGSAVCGVCQISTQGLILAI